MEQTLNKNVHYVAQTWFLEETNGEDYSTAVETSHVVVEL